MEGLRVGFFTEIYRPVVNGVVASVEALADGLRARGHEVYCFAPYMPGYEEADGPVFRMPSLPLADPHGVPADAAAGEPAQSQRHHQAAIADARPLAVRDRLDGAALRAPLRDAAGLHVSHAARSLRALRTVRTERDALCRVAADAHVRQSRRRGRRADARDGGPVARAWRDGADRSRSERHRRRPTSPRVAATTLCAHAWVRRRAIG